MSQKGFRKSRFAWMAGRQIQPDHLPTVAKRVMSLSLMIIVLLSFLFFTLNNTNAYTIDANAQMEAALLMSTGGNNHILTTGVIGNRVWFDANGNGLQDAGEPGVAGVTVTLYNAADDAVVSSTTTDGDGLYSFTDLLEGDYYVGFTLPAERIFTTGNVDGEGISGPNNSDVITSTLSVGFTVPFALGADETNLNVDAGLLPGCHLFSWQDLSPPYVNGNSLPQTFNDIQGLGINMTVEVRLYDEDFDDIGPYISPANQPHPVVEDWGGGVGPFSNRDINAGPYPDAGMIVTKLVFSEPIIINSLWMEAFYFWPEQNVRKLMAIQAFDSQGIGLVPGAFSLYGDSALITVTHPANNQLWLRADFDNSQTVFSGVYDINYGMQPIQEIDWYSWAEMPDGNSFSHVVGSSYFGAFSLCRLTPTAVSLINVQSDNMPVMPWMAGLVGLVFLSGLLLTARQRRKASS